MRIVHAVLGCLAFLAVAGGGAKEADAAAASAADEAKTALAALDTIKKEEWLTQSSGDLLDRVVKASSWGALYAAAKTDTRAQALVGAGHQRGQYTIQTNILAAKFYRMAAGENPIAQNNLGSLMMTGYTDVKADPAEAARLFKLAADQGHPVAQMNLGVLYRDGTGVAQNMKEAERLLELAAKSGKADALYNYASIEAELYGDEVDAYEFLDEAFTDAFLAFKRDADAGSPYAMRRAAEMIFDGEAMYGSTGAEGFAYVEKAAALGDIDAKFRVAECYDKGRGVTKDQAKAAELYRELVKANYAFAFTNLGFLHENGAGVKADKTEARRLYKLAAKAGDARASEHLKRLGETP